MTEKLISSCPNIENFRCNNMNVTIRWDKSISLNDAFRCLPIVTITDTISKKGDQIKIPYYNVEDIIVSIRHKRESRGLRECLDDNQTDNFVTIDLQTGGKNVHMKLSEKNVTVMGITNHQHALDAADCLIDLIRQTDLNLTLIRNSLSEYVDRCEKFIEQLFEIGNNLPTYEEFNLKIQEYNENNKIFPLDENICRILLVYAYESKNFKEFSDIITNITKCGKIEKEELTLTTYEISTSLYNYRLVSKIGDVVQEKMKGIFILRNLGAEIEKLGDPDILPQHNNVVSKYCNVAISVDVINDKGKIVKKVHRFNISEHGSIRQWSPDTREESFKIHNKLIKVLKMIIQKTDNVYIVPE